MLMNSKPVVWVAAMLRRRPWVGVVVWGAAILAVSSLPHPGRGLHLFPGCDKVLHFIEYSILGAALRYWSGTLNPLFPLGGAGFAALDEIHQRYVPGRDASPWDWAADLAGIVIGFILAGSLWRKRDSG
jgi:VanZ family protein